MNTESIAKQIRAKLNNELTVSINDPEGDFDTKMICVEDTSLWDNDAITISGFDPYCEDLKDQDDWSEARSGGKPMVEMRSFQSDSRGGMQGEHPDMWRVFGILQNTFKEMGFQVVGQMEDYF
jgi:hypothetical protein